MEYGVVVRWWLLYQVLLVVGLPFAARLLPDAPDRGASLAVPTAVVLLTVPTLWVGQLAFGLWVVVGVAAALVAASAWLARGGVDVPKRPLAEVVAVFTVAFLFLIAIRAAADGVHPYGGEKFLDFGLLQSLLRADRLPPQDFWFAGERVVYYYGGHLMAATLALLSGTTGRFAYDPALAGFYAMAVTAAYGLASTITAGRFEDSDPVEGSIALGVAAVVFVVLLVTLGVPWYYLAVPAAFAAAVLAGSTRVRAGILAAFVYGFASNLVTPVRLLAGTYDVVREAVVAAGIKSNRAPTISPAEFDMWHASRVVETGINEFPLFAYLNGDLHAHMMSVAVLFLAVGVGLAYARTPEPERRRRLVLLFGAFPVAAATILTVNTWSFPAVAGVAMLSVALADADPRTLLPESVARRFERSSAAAREVQRVLFAVAVAVAVAILGFVVALPFVQSVLLAGASNQHPAAFPVPTQLGAFLLVHGLFLVSFGAYLVSRVARDGSDWAAAGLAAIAAILLAATVDPVIAGVRVGVVAVLLAGPILAGAWLLRRRDAVGFEGVLVVAGAGLVVIIEYVYVADAASYERYNTIFKVYAQVWALWSVPAGVALAALAARTPDASRLRSVGGTALAVLLVVSASIYGGFAVASHVDSADDATLDAFEYVNDERPDEGAAIEWLNEKPGQPHIVSAPGTTPYTWQNPASSLTGIPTVAGWSHAGNYHSDSAYRTRVSDVGVVYETSEAVSRAIVLRKHDVQYVWVGPVERDRYNVRVTDEEPGIRVAFTNENVTVYEVTQSELVEQ
ncbi:DUF2298 domain-containing protein [Halobacterium sp. KA-6]|uniref:DUF2298 domain-containing protein n=1 Tax=Halobacterium sp. KA-6 TaxID=2896368 RepID=UPI001E4C4908|nr:DUF2298 domain-containing protein [Halobacterium sp. KA-6]MCD2202309.1 DUF2298 domain-containing protein [Halobacterium sp. KA-6]